MTPYEWEKRLCTHKLATLSKKSRGRKNGLKNDGIRNEFQRDAHRITYSWPFRRLRHKTQVFFNPNNDHICTRLEHSLLVSSISRTIARGLGLHEDLVEAISLGHDLGHAPFGHYGEKVLSGLCKKHNIYDGKFEHEIHSLRVVDRLAHRDRQNDTRLNLTFEVRDGIVSHCGEQNLGAGDYKVIPTDPSNKDLDSIKCLKDVKTPCTLEGCIVRIADRVAYAGRDVEDGIRAELITSDDVPEEIRRRLGENNSSIVGKLAENIIRTSKGKQYICIDPSLGEVFDELIDFNYKHIYFSKKVRKYQKHAKRGITELFDQLSKDYSNLDAFSNGDHPKEPNVHDTLKDFVGSVTHQPNTPEKQIIIDFIAGMTDNYVNRTIEELFIPRAVI